MEFEFWWLLVLPLLFGAGWFAAKIEGRALLKQSKQLPEAYFRGLNDLLNDHPDKAIDAFTEVVRLDPEAIELHFALGNLFRRRGEAERAIRIHNALVDRQDISNEQRQRAQHELGQDYARAGLLDRAEETLATLSQGDFTEAALRNRLEIAQTVRDWPKALELASRIPGRESQRAHFHCELSAIAIGKKDQASAIQHLEMALQIEPNHPRALLMRTDLLTTQGDFKSALASMNLLAESHSEYLALAARKWLDLHASADLSVQGRGRLESLVQAKSSVDIFVALGEHIEKQSGTTAALAWARQTLPQAPSLGGLTTLLGLADRAQGQFVDAQITRDLVAKQAQRLGRYGCSHCGFQASQYFWQCPGCNQWDTTPPKRLEDQDLRPIGVTAK